MRSRIALLALAGGLLACQDYRFNPVGRCTIQPGQKRIDVTDVTTADVLFVVDDSGSMGPIQTNLANNFGAFITRLAQLQKDRTDVGKQPFEFYLAVTSSSVLVNDSVSSTCTAGLCTISTPQFPPAYSYACSPPLSACADVITRFHYGGSCTPLGLARPYGDPFFDGDLVSAPSNPKVLAFTKALNWASYATDPTIQGLITQFQQNVQLGACGANQEMHLEAARRAIQKAGAGVAPNTGWLHPGAKLVVVWVGNEDDCSTPRADQGGLIWSGGGGGADSCHTEAQKTGPTKLHPIGDYASFFASLGRPLGAAFIRPGSDLPNSGSSCACTSGSCTAYGPGTRFRAMSSSFTALGASVVEGSVCDANFGTTTLPKIADLVKPPSGLKLPSVPAAGVVTQLRILNSSGGTAHVCAGPATSAEWWFVDCLSGVTGGTPAGSTPTACVTVQAGGACEPQPGQSLTAVYLGQVPANGCPSGTGGDQFCADALGGSAADWTCDGASGPTRGTCLCKSAP